MSFWRRWVRRPQDLLLRKVLFQIHLWTGIGVGLYVLMICVSGSVLVYRNELFRTFGAKPVFVVPSGQRLSAEELREGARRAYPAYHVTQVWEGKRPEQAVEIYLEGGGRNMQRLFDPFTGADLGDAVPAGFRFTTWLLDFHDNLLYAETGRRANGVGALLVTLLTVSGAIIWWPGITSWRRSLIIDLRTNWRRLNWNLHSALGVWFFAFVLMWGITGIYLSFPQAFSNVAEFFEPSQNFAPEARISDQILYWLAYAHFGRFGGRIPGCSVTCNATLKAAWAVFGLVPVFMFATGALIWWNRVIRRGRVDVGSRRAGQVNSQVS